MALPSISAARHRRDGTEGSLRCRLDAESADRELNSPRQVLFASLIGTTIEFFDFYIYGTAAVLVFPAWVVLISVFLLRHARPSKPVGATPS